MTTTSSSETYRVEARKGTGSTYSVAVMLSGPLVVFGIRIAAGVTEEGARETFPTSRS